MRHAPTDVKDLQRRLPDRMATALRRYRRGGRRARVLRRAAAVVLLVAAGVIATTEQPSAAVGAPVVVAARDIEVGATIAPEDLRTATVQSPPDGALREAPSVVGRALAGPVRRGEILTDVRLLDASGPRPGAGRIAVPVHVGDGAVLDLLRPGMHVAMVVAPADANDAGAAGAHLLTDDAVVLSVEAATAGPLSGSRDRLVVVAVPAASADAVAAAGLTGAIAVRFR